MDSLRAGPYSLATEQRQNKALVATGTVRAVLRRGRQPAGGMPETRADPRAGFFVRHGAGGAPGAEGKGIPASGGAA